MYKLTNKEGLLQVHLQRPFHRLHNAAFAIRSASCSCTAFAVYCCFQKDMSASKLTSCPFLVSLHCSMLHHILCKNPISPGGILHKHMGYGTCQLPVLEDGTAAHALHNPACKL